MELRISWSTRPLGIVLLVTTFVALIASVMDKQWYQMMWQMAFLIAQNNVYARQVFLNELIDHLRSTHAEITKALEENKHEQK